MDRGWGQDRSSRASDTDDEAELLRLQVGSVPSDGMVPLHVSVRERPAKQNGVQTASPDHTKRASFTASTFAASANFNVSDSVNFLCAARVCLGGTTTSCKGYKNRTQDNSC